MTDLSVGIELTPQSLELSSEPGGEFVHFGLFGFWQRTMRLPAVKSFNPLRDIVESCARCFDKFFKNKFWRGKRSGQVKHCTSMFTPCGRSSPVSEPHTFIAEEPYYRRGASTLPSKENTSSPF